MLLMLAMRKLQMAYTLNHYTLYGYLNAFLPAFNDSPAYEYTPPSWMDGVKWMAGR